MHKSRIEAFSDAVIAIVMTIMVLELKVPHGNELAELMPLLPVFLSYVLSFIYIGIYWNNHHHLFQATSEISGGVLWANLHLMFWLSLTPFVTGWAGENHFNAAPVALYGFVLLMCGVAYWILVRCLLAIPANNTGLLRDAIGNDVKGNISIAIYVIAIPLSFWWPIISCALYIAVACIWFIPDRRIENRMLSK